SVFQSVYDSSMNSSGLRSDTGNDGSTRPKGTIVREQLKYCTTILKALRRHKDASPFLLPVDPIALNIPDYPTIIKVPMDLSTMGKKLDSAAYESADEFINDFKLMINNCFVYNGSESPISKMAKNLEKSFNSYLTKMPTEQSPVGSLYDDERRRRNSNSMHSPDVKRASRARGSIANQVVRKNTQNEHLKYCLQIWKDLTKKSYQDIAWPFLEPVDPIALGVPTYFDIIKHPMDLSTIKKKIDSREYRTSDEFHDDVLLMFNNCRTFNPPDSEIVQMCNKFENVFLNKWKDKPIFTDDFDESSDETDGEYSSDEDSRAIKSIKAQIQNLKSQLNQLRAKKRKTQRKPESATSVSTPAKPSVQKPLYRPLTFEEKKKLSEDINNLNQNQILMVVDIIQKSMPTLKTSETDEIELEIDALDVKTLNEIKNFVNKCNNPTHHDDDPNKIVLSESATQSAHTSSRAPSPIKEPLSSVI
ncbi:Bromodomain-containing protein, partial [Rozella allomycis CSF55]